MRIFLEYYIIEKDRSDLMSKPNKLKIIPPGRIRGGSW